MRRIFRSIIEYETGLLCLFSGGLETGTSGSAAGAGLVSILITHLLRLEFRSGAASARRSFSIYLDAYTRKHHSKSQELPTDSSRANLFISITKKVLISNGPLCGLRGSSRALRKNSSRKAARLFSAKSAEDRKDPKGDIIPSCALRALRRLQHAGSRFPNLVDRRRREAASPRSLSARVGLREASNQELRPASAQLSMRLWGPRSVPRQRVCSAR